MSVLRTYCIGNKRIIAGGCSTKGKVTAVKTCWWIKINTKPVRSHALDGAVFPHIITFSYQVSGRDYIGRRYISCEHRCPQKGEVITVYYDKDAPVKYAVRV